MLHHPVCHAGFVRNTVVLPSRTRTRPHENSAGIFRGDGHQAPPGGQKGVGLRVQDNLQGSASRVLRDSPFLPTAPVPPVEAHRLA